MGRGSCFSFFCPCGANVGCGLFPRRCLGLTCFGLPGRVYPNRQYSPPFFCPFWANVGCGLFSCRVYFSKEARSCGVFYPPPVQADMLSACLEYEDILSDKRRGAHPSPPKGREPDTPPLPWRLLRRLLRIKNPDIQLRRITYPPELRVASPFPHLREGRGKLTNSG